MPFIFLTQFRFRYGQNRELSLFSINYINKILTNHQPLLYHQHYMSFFDLAQKQLECPPKQKISLGPGYYKIQQQSKQKHSYAPFGSLNSKKERKLVDNALGPGNYELRGEIIKPSISKYQNRNIIIVKINNDGGHQFKSKTNRFKSAQHSTIGPGSYQAQIWHRRTKSTSMKSPKINDKIRKINKEHFLKNQPTLTSDPLQFQEQLPHKLPTKVKGIVSWGLNRNERFSIDIKQETTSQDKQRALSQLIHTRKTKVRPSAVFASKSIKSHIQTQIYKTNNSFKAQLRKMINFKDDQPGPGAYEILHQKSQNTPKKFQFFGSTVQRFPQHTEECNVGPGYYVIKDKLLPLRQNDYTYERQTKGDRHSYIPTNTTDPGPGSYEAKQDFVQSLSQQKLGSPFGSGQPRFLQQKKQIEYQSHARLQSTSYCQQKKAKKELQIFHRKVMLQNHPYAIFVSNSKRFKELGQEAKIGDYDVTQNDISSKTLKYQKMAKQLQQCQLIKPPFLSSEERFKKFRTEQSEHKDCWCLIKSVEKQALQRESSAFACKQRRQVFDLNNNTPPVGYYESSSKGILKGSFNSRFRKKNENHIKRDILLRRGDDSRYSGIESGLQPIKNAK